MGDWWKSAWAPNPFRAPIAATVKILSIMTLRPLADVRTLMGHLPTERRERENWRYVADQMNCPRWGSIDGRGVALVRNAFSMTVKYRVWPRSSQRPK